MIDHKIFKQQMPANQGMLPGTEKFEETTHFFG